MFLLYDSLFTRSRNCLSWKNKSFLSLSFKFIIAAQTQKKKLFTAATTKIRVLEEAQDFSYVLHNFTS